MPRGSANSIKRAGRYIAKRSQGRTVRVSRRNPEPLKENVGQDREGNGEAVREYKSETFKLVRLTLHLQILDSDSELPGAVVVRVCPIRQDK